MGRRETQPTLPVHDQPKGDVRLGEGREPHSPGDVEAVDRVEQSDRRHLLEVLDVLPSAGESPGEVVGQRAELLGDLGLTARAVARGITEEIARSTHDPVGPSAGRLAGDRDPGAAG